MSEQNGEQKAAMPAYVSYSTFKSLVDGFREKGTPQQIDNSVLKSYSGAVQSQIKVALRFLDLVDVNYRPTAKLKTLVTATAIEDQKAALGNVLRSSYSFLFSGDDHFDLQSTTASALDGKFRDQGMTGETIRKAVTFFVKAAQDSGIPLSRYVIDSSRKSSSGRSVTKQKSSAGKQSSKGQDQAPPEHEDSRSDTGEDDSKTSFRERLLKSMVEKFPDFDPEASDEMKAAWFENYKWLMEKLDRDDD